MSDKSSASPATGDSPSPIWERTGWTKELWISYWTDVLKERQESADQAKRLIREAGGTIPSETAPRGQHLAIDFEEACRIMGRLASIISATPKEAFKDWALGPEIPYDMVRVAEAFIAKPRSVFAPSATPQKEPQSFVNMRIAYRGFSYGMGSEWGISSLRQAIEEHGDR